jgi:uncharacterized protein YbjT (DUF2867 family)
MNILLFGASGMIGQGALREALLDPAVHGVTVIVRSAIGQQHMKLREIILGDVFEVERIADQLRGFDACLFCAGVTSAGLSERQYTRITYDLTLKVARLLAGLNPDMTFIYVSGAGTDTTETGRFMWARVKGRTENALLGLPFRAAYMFRPGAIQPLHGIKSKTAWYRALYAATQPVYPLLLRLFPSLVTTTEQLGHAMITVARVGYKSAILESTDINMIR